MVNASRGALFGESWEREDAPAVSTLDRASPEYVSWLQRSLDAILGLRLQVDGDEGPKTLSGVRAFQTKRGLRANGVVDDATEAALVAAGAASPPRVALPTEVGIDTNVDTRHLLSCLQNATWKGLHVTFVVRYYSYNPEKNLSLAEAIALSRAGFKCVVVWETRGGSYGFYTRDRGVPDARAAIKQASTCRQPSGTPLYFAVDNYDPSAAAERKLIEQYFEGVKAGLAAAAADAKSNPDGRHYAIGVYATRRVLDWCKAQGITTWYWQSCSRLTSGGKNQYRWPGVSMHQVVCERPLCAGCGAKNCQTKIDFNESDGNEGGWLLPA